MLIPIGTDSPVKRTPVANIGIIVVNVLLYLLFNAVHSPRIEAFHESLYLDGYAPRLYQFFTYQFLHDPANILHIVGNMIFLAVFGNSVNAKMGHIPYLLFYLAGGVFAGAGYIALNPFHLVGASGAIAAVTTAYLVLFPRSYITFLYFFFFIGRIELPGMIMILLKIVLWDNIIEPGLGPEGNVAHTAHLMGYTFGFAAAWIMLMLRAIPRDHFDMLALVKRWYQRKSFAAQMNTPQAQARAQFGRVARPIDAQHVETAISAQLSKVMELKGKITACLRAQDRTAAADFYEQLIGVDPEQVLSAQQQIEVANQLYHLQRLAQAASAYEKYLRHYGTNYDTHQVRLLLGIIYARDLQQYEAARKYLTQAREFLSDSRYREQCDHWLQIITEALGPSAEMT